MANDTKTTSTFCILSGNCEYKLDSQHRVAVPSDWRSQAPTGCFVLMPGRDRTLQLYSEEIYDARIGSGNFGQIMDGARWRAEFEAFNETGDSFLDVLD